MMEQNALYDNTIVTTVMSNLGLYKACDKIGMKYEKTAVGDKYVYENMTQNGFQLGGEQSGHIIFSKHATTGDGILTSLKIMEVILEKKASLATLASEVKIYPQLLQNLKVKDMDATLNHPDVVKAIAEVEEKLGSEGRILVRKSGTEPLLRVMVEALSDELCKEYVDHVIEAMKKTLS
jgi:phosphoglucosamine mutase